MSPTDIARFTLWWGPGILMMVMFGYIFLKIAHYWIGKSMDTKRQQMDNAYSLARQYIEQFLRSQSSQADALSRLANSVEHRESVESFEHQEMLIAIKALHRKLDHLAGGSMGPEPSWGDARSLSKLPAAGPAPVDSSAQPGSTGAPRAAHPLHQPEAASHAS